jgi:hypothetical protein
VIPKGNPGKRRNPSQFTFEANTSSDRDLITHAQWRRGFLEIWNRVGNG